MKIKQASVAGCLNFFKNGFLTRWKLSDYYNPKEPCFFLGAEQVDIINQHKGLKIIYLASRYDCEFLKYLKNDNDIILHWSPYLTDNNDFRVKKVEIEIKDYSIFKPNILGNKIYSYIGFDSRKQEFNYDILMEIQKKINFEIDYTIISNLEDYFDINYLKEKYYDNCFLNLNLSDGTGMTTVRELGLMGRKTITNSPYNFPSQIPYNDIDDIVYIINDESKKIGTIQPSMDCHTVKDEWLDIIFWLN
jgi:hypothetical protein